MKCVYCDTIFEGEICPGCGAPASLIREEIREEEERETLKIQKMLEETRAKGYSLVKEESMAGMEKENPPIYINKEESWYTKNWAIAMFWLLCFPVAPILLLVYKKSWKDWLKTLGLSFLYCILLMGLGFYLALLSVILEG